MNKHEQLIREIAEEMAKEENSTLPLGYYRDWDSMTDKEKEPRIEPYELAARIAVKRMAKEYEAGYFSNYSDDAGREYKLWKANCEYEMEERGLIPEQEGGNRGA